MLETIRSFAAERLGESGEAEGLQRSHAAYFLGLAEEAEPHLRGSPLEWLDVLELEHDNFRAALTRSVNADPEAALRLVAALSDFWIARGHLLEGRRSLDRALGAASGRTAARAKALLGSCGLDFRAGSNAAAAALAEESLTIYREVGDGEDAGRSLHLLGILAWVEGEPSGRPSSSMKASLWPARAISRPFGPRRSTRSAFCAGFRETTERQRTTFVRASRCCESSERASRP